MAEAWPWLRTVVRIALGGVFVVAGVLKVPDPGAAERAIRAYRLLPEVLVAPVAFGLPILEVAFGLLLVVGVLVRPAAAAAAVLLVVFLVGVISAWARGLQIDCGCFGGGGEVAADQTAYPGEVARDLGLLLMAGVLVRWPESRLAGLDRVSPAPVPRDRATIDAASMDDGPGPRRDDR